MLVLSEKLADIHAELFGYERRITEDDLVVFIKTEFGRIGADSHITPREVIRDLIELLDIILQNPELDISGFISSGGISYSVPPQDEETDGGEFAEFKI
jgi:hypothetical protein